VFCPVNHSQTSIQSRVGILVSHNGQMAFGIINCLDLFPMRRDIFYRERFDHFYRHTVPFLCVYTIFETIQVVLQAIVYVLISIVACEVQCDLSSFWYYVLVVTCIFHGGESFGVMILSLIDSPVFSINIATSALVYFTSIAGYISLNVPSWENWLNYGSSIYYANRVEAHLVFDNENFDCDTTDPTCYLTGDQVLSLYSMNDISKANCTLYMILLTVFYRFAAFIALSIKARFVHFKL